MNKSSIKAKYRRAKNLRAAWPYTEKPCLMCGVVKKLIEFGSQHGVKDKSRHTCLDCAREDDRANAEAGKEQRRKLRRKAIVYLGDRCIDCNQQYPDYVYDFHHVKEKTYEMNALIAGAVWKTIKNELDKCVLLCSNCHRQRHPPGPGKVEEGRGDKIREGHRQRRLLNK